MNTRRKKVGTQRAIDQTHNDCTNKRSTTRRERVVTHKRETFTSPTQIECELAWSSSRPTVCNFMHVAEKTDATLLETLHLGFLASDNQSFLHRAQKKLRRQTLVDITCNERMSTRQTETVGVILFLHISCAAQRRVPSLYSSTVCTCNLLLVHHFFLLTVIFAHLNWSDVSQCMQRSETRQHSK